MTVDVRTSLTIVREELANCQQDRLRYGWDVSEIDEANQTFTVRMKSPVDDQLYIIEIKFDNYKEWPLYIDFIDPATGEKGTKKAYPTNSKFDGFFHGMPCICHPASRKAYKDYNGPHNDWNITGWQQNSGVGTLTDIRAILRAIYSRISDPDKYAGRMNG